MHRTFFSITRSPHIRFKPIRIGTPKIGHEISLVCSLTVRFGFAKLGKIRPWSPPHLSS
ncbi:hypothetical protein RB7451 [Rhodopirellula baltica SH 1]|uniref:Uncharacterized protein n=1 Tax=Rhodopirellula baltica (strain DSM 10527 / NCIMB 13988 / SH1) TaxID=243090 RepID=Q7UNP8_RHOBA|nr:hypothetical protein RB7451 [Rhodopirellula baltica SH 1]